MFQGILFYPFKKGCKKLEASFFTAFLIQDIGMLLLKKIKLSFCDFDNQKNVKNMQKKSHFLKKYIEK